MTVALLSIGTELTRGDIANSNGAWLARELTQLGFDVVAIDTVDDDAERIVQALARLTARHSIVICTGGLGPTTDDLTTACVAKALGTDLELHAPSVEAIAQRLAKMGRSLSDSNKKQAYFPKGATILPNDWGTAPGFSVRLGQAKLYFLPGVPHEMMALFEHRVVSDLGIPKERAPFEILLRSYGLPESTLNDRLDGIAQSYDVVIGYRVRFPEIDIKVHAQGVDGGAAQTRAELAADAIVERVSSVVYGRGETTLPRVIGELLMSEKLNLSVAESCTGGLVASLLSGEPGASRWFQGGIVAYSNEAKTRLLGVDPAILQTKGAVSLEVAEAMAVGACQALGTEVAIGITGVAGPSGGSPGKPIGTVCFGMHGPFGTHSEVHQFNGDRQRIQQLASYHAMSQLWSRLAAKANA
jgi:nicotinamide-nucleotide amidase